jgi:hypothetical protein
LFRFAQNLSFDVGLYDLKHGCQYRFGLFPAMKQYSGVNTLARVSRLVNQLIARRHPLTQEANNALKPIVISLVHFVHSLHAEGLASALAV